MRAHIQKPMATKMRSVLEVRAAQRERNAELAKRAKPMRSRAWTPAIKRIWHRIAVQPASQP